jgi:hypothetical protein
LSAGRVVARAALLVDAIEDVLHGVLRGRDLAGQDAGLAGLGRVLGPFRRRELVATVRAARIARGDDRMTLRALLCWGLAAATSVAFLNLDLVHRAVPQHIAAEVQHQTVLLARVQAETPANHLAIKPGR